MVQWAGLTGECRGRVVDKYSGSPGTAQLSKSSKLECGWASLAWLDRRLGVFMAGDSGHIPPAAGTVSQWRTDCFHTRALSPVDDRCLIGARVPGQRDQVPLLELQGYKTHAICHLPHSDLDQLKGPTIIYLRSMSSWHEADVAPNSGFGRIECTIEIYIS